MTATSAAASSSSISSSSSPPHHLPGGGSGGAPSTTLFQNEQAVVRKAGRQAIKLFLESHHCFAVLRTSGKVVVFDIRIPIQLAFYALVEHDMLAAPLWDPVKCQFIGLLTVTDFIDILRYYKTYQKDVSSLAICSIAEILALLKQEGQEEYDCLVSVQQQQQTSILSPNGTPMIMTSTVSDSTVDAMTTDETNPMPLPQQQTVDTLSQETLATIDTMTSEGSVVVGASANSNNTTVKKNVPLIARTFHGADSACTLHQACEQLLSLSSTDRTTTPMMRYQQNFLPIVFVEDMRVLSCITFTTILEHLVTHFREQRRLFDDTIMDLNIGTYEPNIISIYPNQTILTALELMFTYQLSALPVVENITSQDGSIGKKIIGVYSRSDITFLTRAVDAEDAVKNLDMTVGEILMQTRNDVTTPDAIRTCNPNNTLQAIFESFAQLRFNRLYIVNPTNETLIGVVSARDLVSYFLRTDINETNINNDNMHPMYQSMVEQ